MSYDLIIIGGGPAGVSAGVYAARKQLRTLLITESFGGQSVDSVGVENWIGTPKVSGPELAKMLESHLRTYAGDVVEIHSGERAEKIEKDGSGFKVSTSKGSYQSETVLIATGSSRRKLDVPGGKEFDNKGISYCASCDGPLFSGQDVAVIGGGNAAFESVAQLAAYAKSVTLIHRSAEFKADPVTVEKISSNPKVKLITNAVVKEIKGDALVSSIIYTDSSGDHELPVQGIFVEIGLIPATSFAEGLVPMNNYKQVITDPKNQRTQVDGIWAAGDSTDSLYHQNNIAAGDAVKALEDIYLYIHAK